MGIVVVALAVFAGATYAGMRYIAATDERDAETNQAATVENPEPYVRPAEPGAAGGTVGKNLRRTLGDAGYGCGRVEYDGAATIECSRAGEPPDAVLSRVTMDVTDSDLVELEAEVEPDPAWQRLPRDGDSNFGRSKIDTGPATSNVFGTVAAGIAGQDGAAGIQDAIRRSRKDEELVKNETADYVMRIDVPGGTMSVRGDTEDVAAFDNARTGDGGGTLKHVALKDLEKIAEENALPCERGRETLTCQGGSLLLRAEFPEGLALTSVRIVDDRADEHLSADLREVAGAVAGLVGRQVGQREAADKWADSGCFADTTRSLLVGGEVMTCEPTLDGTVRKPKVEKHSLVIGKER